MQIAIVAAGFTPAEADQLRRAMATFKRSRHDRARFSEKMIDGMVARRLSARVRRALLQADRGLRRIRLSRKPRGELRAAGLCLVLDQMLLSRRLRRGACSTAQPMGFYAPAQLVRDAREHGVEVREVDINASDWDCTLEPAALQTASSGMLHPRHRGDGRSTSARRERCGSASARSTGFQQTDMRGSS